MSPGTLNVDVYEFLPVSLTQVSRQTYDLTHQHQEVLCPEQEESSTNWSHDRVRREDMLVCLECR